MIQFKTCFKLTFAVMRLSLIKTQRLKPLNHWGLTMPSKWDTPDTCEKKGGNLQKNVFFAWRNIFCYCKLEAHKSREFLPLPLNGINWTSCLRKKIQWIKMEPLSYLFQLRDHKEDWLNINSIIHTNAPQFPADRLRNIHIGRSIMQTSWEC